MMLATHLWQSTVCVGVAALLAAALARAPARTRHAVWLFASLKFLVPFSLFVTAGSYLGAWTWPLLTPGSSAAAHWFDRSLALWTLSATAGLPQADFKLSIDGVPLIALAIVWACGAGALAVWRVTEWRAVSRLTRTAARLETGRVTEALRRAQRNSIRPRSIELLECTSNMEPAVVGIRRPRLLWPHGLSERLTDAELEAVMSHELRHVARNDNLSALIHVVVETAFWFHPLVWWLGSRLVSERENACDEEVLQMGTDNRSYAEGILKVCGFCLRSPGALAAGVSGGSSLSDRLERILKHSTARRLGIPLRILLAGAFIATAGAPLATGVVSARQDKPNVYRPGNGVTLPKLIREVKPSYTRSAMQARIQGVVRLECVVLEDGTVGDVEVTQSLDKEHGLDDQAVLALKQWLFSPGTKDEKPVRVLIEVEMSFTLKK
jgi:bla regulator protein BlaR1